MTPESPAGVLVGRADELGRLRTCVAGVAAGRGRSVWVEGEPGIGKSALVAAGLAEAQQGGCAVFRGLADELSGGFPLRVLLDCLQVGPGSADEARAEIAELLQSAGSSGAVTPGDVIAAVAERLQVLVERLCAVSPVVLVADDLQWADEASLAVWQRLHRAVRQLPLLLVAVCRPVPRRAELTALRRGMSGPDAMVVGLGPLGPAAVAELAGRLLGATPGPRLRRHGEQAGGNPLYVRELVDALVRERLVHIESGMADLVSEARPPVSLAVAIAGRLGFLSEPAASVLRAAAVLGPAFSVSDLAVLTGRATGQLVEVVQEATAAGVLVESGDRLAFRHGLIRQALYEGMPVSLRSALHRQAAEALVAAGAPVPDVAMHLLAAPDVADAWVVGWVADVAAVLVYRAPEIAVDLLRRVCDAARPQDPRRDLLGAGLSTALFLLGRYDEVVRLARPVLARTRDAEVAGRMAWTLGYALLRAERVAEALAVTGQEVAERELTPKWTARVRSLRALIMENSRNAGAEAVAGRAVVEGEQAGDRLSVGYALHVMHLIQNSRGDQQACLAAVDRALAVIGDEPETSDLRLLLLGNRSVPLDNMGRVAEARRGIAEALALAERAGSPQRLANIRVQAADNHFRYGEWDDALAELDGVAADASLDVNRLLWLNGLAALIACHRDDRVAAGKHISAVEDIELTGGYLRYYGESLRMAQALTAERDAHPKRALELLRAMYDEKWAQDAVARMRSHLWLPDVARLALEVGDRPFAAAATGFCVAEADRLPLPNRQAAAEHCRGLMSGDPGQLLAAADLYRDSALPLFRAQALENAAVALARRGDSQAARAASTTAIDLYTGLGAVWDVRRTNTRLREHGIRHGFRGRRGRPTRGWDALTPTELKIAELIAAGQSNPDIAAELWLSRRTVQSHVSHILTKLDARSRVEIARAAFDRMATHRVPVDSPTSGPSF